ncbi:MAG: phosphatase domain-containing protein [Ferruginibacter sp.]
MSSELIHKHTLVKVYHGFGHKQSLTLYGHVYKNKFTKERSYNNNIAANIIYLVKLFCIKPIAGARIQLEWRKQVMESTTEKDGFYKFEWESEEDVAAGWHSVTVNLLNEAGHVVKGEKGKVFVPHITQFGFISDIDDTVMVSHSSTIFKRLRVLFTKNPRTRRTFEDVVRHYKLLSEAHTTLEVPNPFFYVSSSEWNLYDELSEFFRHNELPAGVFLLSQVKRWYQLFKTGKTKHEAKLLRVYRIIDAFPHQQFILIGDNSQSDPIIYNLICEKYPEKVFAVYIRNISYSKTVATKDLLRNISRHGIATCLFENNTEAIEHSRNIGLII